MILSVLPVERGQKMILSVLPVGRGQKMIPSVPPVGRGQKMILSVLPVGRGQKMALLVLPVGPGDGLLRQCSAGAAGSRASLAGVQGCAFGTGAATAYAFLPPSELPTGNYRSLCSVGG